MKVHKAQTAQKIDSQAQNNKNHNRSIVLERSVLNTKLLGGGGGGGGTNHIRLATKSYNINLGYANSAVLVIK